MENAVHLLQWPAMAVSLFGAWWIGDPACSNRRHGFSVLILSNVIWLIWAISDAAWALGVMQILFLIVNGRGYYDNLGKNSKRVRMEKTNLKSEPCSPSPEFYE